MTSRLRDLPFGVDRILFDGLNFNDLVNTILEYPRYSTRQGRIETGLEAYLRERIIHDFIGDDLYEEAKDEIETVLEDVLEKYNRSRTNTYLIDMFKAFFGDLIGPFRGKAYNIDPLLVYMVLSDIIELNHLDSPESIFDFLQESNLSYILNSLANVLFKINETNISFTRTDINDFVYSVLDNVPDACEVTRALTNAENFRKKLEFFEPIIYIMVKYFKYDPMFSDCNVQLIRYLVNGIYPTNNTQHRILSTIFKKILDGSDFYVLLINYCDDEENE